jgi:hypothetical protein
MLGSTRYLVVGDKWGNQRMKTQPPKKNLDAVSTYIGPQSSTSWMGG